MLSTKRIKHLFSIDDLTKNDIESILDNSATLEKAQCADLPLANKIAGLCFFQQSTRTRIGFDAAMKRLGGSTLSIFEPREVLHAPAGESLEDTIRVVSAYCDILVIRHPNTMAVKKAMQVSLVPVINAGSGVDYHPTQALIDLFHIKKHFGQLGDLRIGIVGDLQTSRAAKSLIRALRHWMPTELRLMFPPGRMSTDDDLAGIDRSVISMHNVLVPDKLDVLYVAGLPNPERTEDFSSNVRKALNVTSETIATMPDHSILMCPLPRIDEIDPQLDRTTKATYFMQSDNGLWVRMATLHMYMK